MLKAPFPYFGGKSKVAAIVWQALGQPRHYIEPFCGSCAVLLARPGYDSSQHIETVNDKDGFIANAWRSIQFSPDEVARWCDWPVNHADLTARKAELLRNEERLLQNLISDPKWHDPVIAGYWIWAASCWIGSGLTRSNAIVEISKQGKGIYAIGQRPHMEKDAQGKGVHCAGKRPHLTEIGQGKGVHAGIAIERERERERVQVPHLTDNKGVIFSGSIYDWMDALSRRLRRVRVVCGDWKQVCGGNWQDGMGSCGMFFDPPYSVTDRDTNVYHHDSTDVAKEVNAWVLERGKKSTYRIVLAGYRDEHQNLLEHGWKERVWTANGGYGNRAGNKNRERETLFFSPYCVMEQLAFSL